MPICLDSKKAKKNARKHAAARAKVFPNSSPMVGKTWAVTLEEIQATENWGWDNQDGSMKIAPALNAPSTMGTGDWEAAANTCTWTDGVPIKVEETRIPEWVDTSPPKTDEELLKERADKALVGWPWNGVPSRLVSVAPYTFNENVHRTLPIVNQASSLFLKLFGNAIVLEKVCHNLFQHHDAAWKFSTTCKEAWEIMRFNIDTWDMTKGYFHKCEKPRSGPDAPEDPFDMGCVAPIVMVTPVRRAAGPATYVEQIQNLHKLCLSISNFSDYFQNLQLHRIPFLTTDLLSLLIPKMRNLKILGIYNCQLIHVGETMKLLDIIKTDRVLEKENQVSLDFFPNFHLGPVEEPGNPYSVGSYGVTWDNWNFDTCRALWCLVIQILFKARSQGIDFESKHTMFRQWMEKGPCHKVEETIASIMNPESSLEVIAAMINYHRTQGKVERLNQCNRPDGTHWAIRSYRCTTCRERMMGIFFSYTHIHERETGLSPHLSCSGCLLTSHLRRENDHYKPEKRRIMRSWLVGQDGLNKDDLTKALVDYHDRDILTQAKQLANQRLTDMTMGPDPYDKELNERQIPITKKELNGKTTTHKRSPQVFEELPGKGCDYIRVERYDGHHLGD